MYHIIANANALSGKNSKKLEIVKSVFDRAGKEYAVHLTERQGHAGELARELTSSGQKHTLIAMGGDGTLHEVLNGICDVENCFLGVIPVGTGNDFAAAAGIPDNVKTAAEIIAFKAPVCIDYIEFTDGLRSINAAGTGLDVDVLKRTYSGRFRGKGKYYLSLLQSLIHFKSSKFTVIYDGKEETHNGLMVSVGNGIQYGGGIKVFPDAKIDDGYMDLVIVDYLTRFKTISALLKLNAGKLDGIKEITQAKCKHVKYISEDGYTVQAEGELYDNLDFEAQIVSGKLKFYLPKND